MPAAPTVIKPGGQGRGLRPPWEEPFSGDPTLLPGRGQSFSWQRRFTPKSRILRGNVTLLRSCQRYGEAGITAPNHRASESRGWRHWVRLPT